MDLDPQYEQIEAYLNNELSAEARASFETKIKANSELKAAVMSHVLANEALGLTIEDRIAGKLEKLAQQEANVTVAPLKVGWKKTLAIAATLLFLVFAGLLFWANQNYSNQVLLAQNYIESTLPTVRNDAAMVANFQAALAALSVSDTEKAKQALASILPNQPYFLEAQYILADIAQKEQNYAAARQYFTALLNAQNLPKNIDREEIEWNYLLCLLPTEGASSTEFQERLNVIINNDNHTYQNKAIDLEVALNSFWRKIML